MVCLKHEFYISHVQTHYKGKHLLESRHQSKSLNYKRKNIQKGDNFSQTIFTGVTGDI